MVLYRLVKMNYWRDGENLKNVRNLGMNGLINESDKILGSKILHSIYVLIACVDWSKDVKMSQ